MNSLFTKIIPLSLLFMACTHEQAEHKTTVKSESQDLEIKELPETVIKDSSIFAYEYRDSTYEEDFEYEFDFRQGLSELDFSLYPNIERSGDSLIFHTQDSTVYLITEGFDELTQDYMAPTYQFETFHHSANVAEIKVYCYEYWYHVLVDMASGDTLNTIGKSAFSDDGKMIFSSNLDLETGFTENGFQFSELSENGFNHLKTTILNTWGIAKATWVNKNELRVLKATIDTQYDLLFSPGSILIKYEAVNQ